MPSVTCPNGHRIQVSDRHIGRVIKCPGCRASFVAEPSGESLAVDEGEGTESQEPSRAARSGKGLLEGTSIGPLANTLVGRPLLFAGLLMVVLGRGCDATSMRSVARTDAQYRQAKVTFQIEWDTKMSVAQQKIDNQSRQFTELIETTEKRDDNFQKRMEEAQREKASLQKELGKLRLDHSSAMAENENGAWKPLRDATRRAADNRQMSAYWYECLFISGTLVLVVGILTLGFTGRGPEQWVSYIMLIIITFSIYIGGAAWIESIVTSAQSVPVTANEHTGGFLR